MLTIGRNRMICLTKYVTVCHIKGRTEPLWWFLVGSRLRSLPVNAAVMVYCACTFSTPFAPLSTLPSDSPCSCFARRCINRKIEISAWTIITIVIALPALPACEVRYRIASGSHDEATASAFCNQTSELIVGCEYTRYIAGGTIIFCFYFSFFFCSCFLFLFCGFVEIKGLIYQTRNEGIF